MLPRHTHLLKCKVNEETSVYEHSNESIKISTLNTDDEIRNHLLSYDILILEDNFHDVWVECNVTLYWASIGYLWAAMPSFGKSGGSHNSYEMRMSGMPGMVLLIYPSLRTYTTNIGIWLGSILMFASMFWVTLAGNSTSSLCGRDTGFHNIHMIYVG